MERTKMGQIYQTKARQTWANFLRYDEADQAYKFCVDFMYGNWGEPNRIVLVFDKQGEYVGTRSFVRYKFRKETIEKTEKDHVLYALNFKEKAEKLIKMLIEPIEKEHIIVDQRITWAEETEVYIHFDIGELSYRYEINVENPYGDRFLTACKKDIGWEYIKIHDIPSLEWVKSYIRNHPKIRVKFVNELARYEQAKKKIEKYK